MSGKKGIYGSKLLVKCGYCNESKRKDNLQRHIDNKHPGEPFKFTFITCSSGGIKNFLKATEDISSDTFSVPIEEVGNIDDVDHVGTEIYNDETELCVQYADENIRDNLKLKDEYFEAREILTNKLKIYNPRSLRSFKRLSLKSRIFPAI